MTLEPGTRIRLNDRCPWPKRRGAEGVVVAPRHSLYPQNAAGHVLVLLDHDPLFGAERGRWWTCQVGINAVDVVEADRG